MQNKAEWIAGGLGGAMVLAVVAVFAGTHYQAIVHPRTQQTAAQNGTAGLSFPTIDQMCKAAGAGPGEMPGCISDETSAAEFVGAWLDLNGFITDGRIDIDQIQLSAELDAADTGLAAPSPADPLNSDPLGAADPSDTGLAAPEPDFALPGVTTAGASPAQTALLCLSTAADDWLKMHDCIAQNDPSSTLDGN